MGSNERLISPPQVEAERVPGLKDESQPDDPISSPGEAFVDPLLPRHLFQSENLDSGSEAAPAPPIKRQRAPKEKHLLPSARKASRDAELPSVGAIIDKYRLEELLGTGGFAGVYRATHLLLNNQVAIKLLRPSVLRRQPSFAKLLFAEARFGATINHPNVARVYDATHSGSVAYIVMEFVEGSTLAQAISAQGKLPLDVVLRVGLDVTLGLRAGLEHGLIHRDIKPANILLAKTGETKIVDFGLAQPTGALANEDVHQSRLARVGTYGYMAPEQARDARQVDFRADIYSLGVTLYEASVGCPPFPTSDRKRCMEMHERDPVPPPDELVPGFPRAFSDLLIWMLAKTVTARPASYAVLLDHLRAAQKFVAPRLPAGEQNRR